jgi:two-component system NarL family sensor kinase
MEQVKRVGSGTTDRDRRAIAECKRLEEELRESEARRQSLTDRLLTVQVEEQRRFAREIHDGLAQTANVAYQQLQAFAELCSVSDARERERLDRALELLWLATEEARQLIAGLRPPLADAGLTNALRNMVEALRAEGLETTLEVLCQEARLPETVETALYGVAREALNNVRKHADAKRAHVQVRQSEGSVRLRVQDWGRGFRPFDACAGAHSGERVGLCSMRERIRLVNGELEISSRPGIGTTVVAEVPLSASQRGAAIRRGRYPLS